MSAAAELQRVQDAALEELRTGRFEIVPDGVTFGRLPVPDPATEPVTVRQLDAEPTPVYDAVVRELRPTRFPISA